MLNSLEEKCRNIARVAKEKVAAYNDENRKLKEQVAELRACLEQIGGAQGKPGSGSINTVHSGGGSGGSGGGGVSGGGGGGDDGGSGGVGSGEGGGGGGWWWC